MTATTSRASVEAGSASHPGVAPRSFERPAPFFGLPGSGQISQHSERPRRSERADRMSSDRQSGQAVLVLLMVAVCMLLFLSLLYHSGTLILLRMKLQNTADASAMAGATEQARGMQAIAKLNSNIVDLIIEANEDTFGDHDAFHADLEAATYIDGEYLERIEELVQQIEDVQTRAPGRVRLAAQEVARRNLDGSMFGWHSPKLTQLGSEVLVKLQDRKEEEFHYIVKATEDSPPDHRKLRAPTYFRGMTDEIVYSAVEVRAENLNLGDSIFPSTVTEMSAYAAAKPWGGHINGFDPIAPRAIVWRTKDYIIPRAITLWLRRWNGPQVLLEHDPLDYDAWLVRIGDPRLNPAPVGIPDQAKFVH